MRLWRSLPWLTLSAILTLLAGCASAPRTPASSAAHQTRPAPSNVQPHTGAQSLPVLPPAGSGRGGYYQDDGPGDNPPEGLRDIPDAQPKVEPISKRRNRPYVVFGKTYTPILDDRPYKQRGIGSWYGKKFHGQRTSSGELYDMYKMTAAHPTLPIPSFARITNVDSGRQIIVRVNDRGPFHAGRIADLSYTAALKLGFLGKGSHEIEVERLLPDEIARINAQRGSGQTELASAAPTPSQISSLGPGPVINQTVGIGVAAVEPPPQLAIETMLRTDRIGNAAVSPGAAPLASQKDGYYLQFGAYAQADNAEMVRIRLARNWPDTSLPAVEVVQSDAIYRLYSGPFDTRAEADNAAQSVQNDDGSKPIVVQRALHGGYKH
jgi:rare lipoprotein A